MTFSAAWESRVFADLGGTREGDRFLRCGEATQFVGAPIPTGQLYGSVLGGKAYGSLVSPKLEHLHVCRNPSVLAHRS